MLPGYSVDAVQPQILVPFVLRRKKKRQNEWRESTHFGKEILSLSKVCLICGVGKVDTNLGLISMDMNHL